MGELEVALVVGGHRHDRPGAVAHEHVVGDEHGDVPAVGGVLGERPGEDAGLLLALGLALELGLPPGELAVGRHRLGGELVEPERAAPLERRVLGPLVGDDLVDERVLGREHHVGRAEQRVGAGGEHVDLDVGVLLHREHHLGADAAADPVALHQLDRLGPVEHVEVGEQAVGVGGDAQHPLLQRALEDGMVAAFAATVGGDLLVGEHGAERGAPVHRRLVEVGQPVRVDDGAPRVGVEVDPGEAVGVGVALRGVRPRLELRDQLGDRPGAVLRLVVPRVEELQEDPLGPAVVVGVGGGDPPAGVVAQAEGPELAAHVGHVGLGGDPGVLTGLHRVLLGREPEGVVAHGVEHVVAPHAHEAGEHVGADVAEGVPTWRPAPLGYGNMSRT